MGSDPQDADTIPATQASLPTGSHRTDGDSKLVSVESSRYQLGAEIARGGMGRILAARDLRHERPVAIKELTAGDDRRFEREALITAALQHPAIVPVYEAGRWPNGSPFYAMKLVEGEPLDRMIAKQESLDQRIALVPNVIAAADALAYAHERRIIHRDLKPANVLVGRFGETYVIDWGVAKRLDLPDDDAPTLRPSTAHLGGSELTHAGDVIGTPLYMPPEQAAGEAVDQRADVYALGAMLYHVLAGAPPFEPARVEVMLAHVMTETPRALADRTPGVPVDLVAIVEKAMARDKTQRYANAEQLAADLRRFQAGQLVLAHDYSLAARAARFVRKNRLAVAVVALLGIAGVVLAFQRERVVAEHRRAQLELARATAERDHANTLVATLHELTPKLLRLGRLDLLDNLALKLIDYYKTRELQDPVEHRGYGIALLVHGYVQHLHRTRGGIDASETLQHARGELLPFPGDRITQAVLLDVWTDLALTDLSPRERLEDANQGIAVAEQLARDNPHDVHITRAWAKALCARAGVHSDEGEFTEARADLDHAAALIAQLPAPRDDDETAEHGEVVVLLHAGTAWLENQQGHTREARQAYDDVRASAVSTLRRVNDALVLDGQADAAQWSCLLSRDLGDDTRARAACDEATRASAELVAIDRSNVESMSELAEAHLATAHLDGDDARSELDAALQLAKQLDPEYEADVRRDIAKWASEHHEWEETRAQAESAVAILRAISAAKPNDTPMIRRIAWNLDTAGLARLELGDLDGAGAHFDEEVAITSRLLAAEPDARPLQTDLAGAKESLARLALVRHDAGKAHALAAEAIEIRERVAAADPDDEDNRKALAGLRQLTLR